MERFDPEVRHSPLKDPLPQMNIWRVWHPDYGVIYDEIAEVKKKVNMSGKTKKPLPQPPNSGAY